MKEGIIAVRIAAHAGILPREFRELQTGIIR